MTPKAFTYASAAALLLATGTASAFTIPSGGTDSFGRPIAGAGFEDDDLDFFIDNNSDGLLNSGDQIVAPFEFQAINDIFADNGIEPSQSLNQSADELVGLSTITVDSIDGTDTDGDGDFDSVDRVDFRGNADGTPMVQIFNLGGSTNLDIGSYSNCDTLANCVAAATDGNLWAEFDIAEADDEWFFNPAGEFDALADNPDQLASLGASTKVGAANFALSLVNNESGFTFLEQYIGCATGSPTAPDGVFQCSGDGLTDLVGSADVLGGSGLPSSLLDDGAFARTDTDMQLNTVPEPGVLALLGVGLIGMVAPLRRRKRA